MNKIEHSTFMAGKWVMPARGREISSRSTKISYLYPCSNERVRCMCRCLIAVNGFHFQTSSFCIKRHIDKNDDDPVYYTRDDVLLPTSQMIFQSSSAFNSIKLNLMSLRYKCKVQFQSLIEEMWILEGLYTQMEAGDLHYFSEFHFCLNNRHDCDSPSVKTINKLEHPEGNTYRLNTFQRK